MSWKPSYMIGVKPKLARLASRISPGFTLMEVIISVSIFVVIMLSATQIFKMVIDGQRSAIASQNVQESLKYFLEVIGKEIRTAKKNEGVCPQIPATSIFKITTNSYGDVLNFRNYYNECVTYNLQVDYNSVQRFLVTRSSGAIPKIGYISPHKIMIDSLHFALREGTSTQPTITINIKAHALDEAQFKSEMVIQTSVASRYYK